MISSNPNMSFKMPTGNTTVNAVFQNLTKYNVTLTDGCEKATGGGQYYPGTRVTLDATNVPFFLEWNDINGNAIDPQYSNNGKTLTFTMPGEEVAFWIAQEECYEVIVSSNASAETSGSGFYRPGDVVTIRSGNPAGSEQFDCWDSSPGSIAFASKWEMTTTFTMISELVNVWPNWIYN